MGVEAVTAVAVTDEARPWWERRWFLALIMLATAVPLIYPPVPPLVDLLGSLSR